MTGSMRPCSPLASDVFDLTHVDAFLRNCVLPQPTQWDAATNDERITPEARAAIYWTMVLEMPRA
jgi:hypothetical protein